MTLLRLSWTYSSAELGSKLALTAPAFKKISCNRDTQKDEKRNEKSGRITRKITRKSPTDKIIQSRKD